MTRTSVRGRLHEYDSAYESLYYFVHDFHIKMCRKCVENRTWNRTVVRTQNRTCRRPLRQNMARKGFLLCLLRQRGISYTKEAAAAADMMHIAMHCVSLVLDRVPRYSNVAPIFPTTSISRHAYVAGAGK
jgi:hypothetical protein